MRSRISRAIAPGAMVAAVSIALVLLQRELRSFASHSLKSLVIAGPMIERALDHLVAGE